MLLFPFFHHDCSPCWTATTLTAAGQTGGEWGDLAGELQLFMERQQTELHNTHLLALTLSLYMTLERSHDCPFSHTTTGLCPVPLLFSLVLGNTTQAENPTQPLRHIVTMPGYHTQQELVGWFLSYERLSLYHLDPPDVSGLLPTSPSVFPMVRNASYDC